MRRRRRLAGQVVAITGGARGIGLPEHTSNASTSIRIRQAGSRADNSDRVRNRRLPRPRPLDTRIRLQHALRLAACQRAVDARRHLVALRTASTVPCLSLPTVYPSEWNVIGVCHPDPLGAAATGAAKPMTTALIAEPSRVGLRTWSFVLPLLLVLGVTREEYAEVRELIPLAGTAWRSQELVNCRFRSKMADSARKWRTMADPPF